MRKVIVGIGNLLLKDEGVGVHVVKALEERELPPEVEVVDGGTATIELLSLFREADKVVVIDALKGGGEPGSIYRVTPEDLMAVQDRPLSLHQVGLLEVLEMARHLGSRAEVVILGVEPAEIAWGMELSPGVAAKVPRVAELALKEVGG